MRKAHPEIKAVAFDAVGTLIQAEPSVGEVYARVAAECGSPVHDPDGLKIAFRDALATEDEIDRHNEWRTSEEREQERWRRIVGHCLPDGADVEAAYSRLFEWFARPEAWALIPNAVEALRFAQAEGLAVAVASNFDARLRRVLEGHEPLREVETVAVSSEVGWMKPSPNFFRELCSMLGAAPGEVLFVGDSRRNDYEAATASGLRAVLFDQFSKWPFRE